MFGPDNARQTPPRLTLMFFVTAFLALPAAHLLLAGSAQELLRYHRLPAAITLAHVVVLGWIALAIMGALYQLTPVVIQAPLVSVRLIPIQFVAFVAGAGELVAALALGRGDALPYAGAAIAFGALLFLLNICLSFRRIRVWSVPARYLAVALAFFAFTAILGLLFALDRRYGWFPIPAGLLAVHVHLGVAGFFGLTLLGVSYRLFAMFALVRGHDERLANANLALLSASLLLLALALLLDAAPLVAFVPALGLALGFLAHLWDMTRMYRLRLKRRWDLYLWHMAATEVCLLALVPMGVLTATGLPQRLAGETPWLLTYGYVALGGWLTMAIVGHAYKIVPMLVWQQRYRGHAVAGSVPLLTEMYSHRLAVLTLVLYTAGFAGTTAGLLTDWPDLVRVAGLLSLAAVSLLLLNMTVVLIRRPARAAGRAQAAGLVPAGSERR